VWVDGGYFGTLLTWARERFRLVLEVVKRPLEQKGFAVLPHRWVVERTFAWLANHRRLSKEYERLMPTSEAFIRTALDTPPLAAREERAQRRSRWGAWQLQ